LIVVGVGVGKRSGSEVGRIVSRYVLVGKVMTGQLDRLHDTTAKKMAITTKSRKYDSANVCIFNNAFEADETTTNFNVQSVTIS
jgi:hypothetical protein